MSERSRQQLLELGNSAKRAMLIFQDAIARHNEAVTLGLDAEILQAQQLAHDSLDAYFDHLRALNGARAEI